MANRLVIQGGGVPIRISISGQDAASAGPMEMVFDGQYRTLPIFQQGQFEAIYAITGSTPSTITFGGHNDVLLSKTWPSAPFALFYNSFDGSEAVSPHSSSWTGRTGTTDGSNARPWWVQRESNGEVRVRSFGAGRYIIFDRAMTEF